MKSFAAVIAAILILVAVALAAVTCPLHPYAACYNTGQIAPGGSGAIKWHCSCGDDVWVSQ